MSFVDDCITITWPFLLKHKSYVSEVFPNFWAMIKNQFGTSIKNIRTDNARDYFNQILSPFLKKERIIHHSSCVDTPNRTDWLDVKIEIFLKLLEPFYFKTMFLKHIGERPFQQLYI